MVSNSGRLNTPYMSRKISLQNHYLPYLDGIRVVALLPVVIWHISLRGDRLRASSSEPFSAMEQWFVDWIPKGEVGVELFFVLSGYLLTLPYVGNDKRRIETGRFYTRRLKRLSPPYLCVIFLSFIAMEISGYAPADAPSVRSHIPLLESFLSSLLYMHQFIFGKHPSLNPPLWSLEIEMQFYILLPFIIKNVTLLNKIRLSAFRGFLLICLWSALTTIFCFYLYEGHYSLLRFSHFFILGIYVSLYIEAISKLFNYISADLILCSSFLLIIATGSVMDSEQIANHITVDLIRILAFSLLIVSLSNSSRGKCVLSSSVFVSIGGMTYSIYLIHVPVIQVAAEILKNFVPNSDILVIWPIYIMSMLPACLLAALILYIGVEQPSMDPNWISEPGRYLTRRFRSVYVKLLQFRSK